MGVQRYPFLVFISNSLTFFFYQDFYNKLIFNKNFVLFLFYGGFSVYFPVKISSVSVGIPLITTRG
jgi:hypothetical protein